MIPNIGLGTWVFGGKDWGGQDPSASRATLRAALAAGINHIDTAQAYGSGLAETMVGDVLADHPRADQVFVASKTFTKTPEKLRRLIDVSRQRLQRDCIDLYYLHWPRRGLDLRPLLAELEAARQRGWIGGVGVSNFSVADLESVSEVAQVDALQIGWNLLWRAPEQDLVPYCRERGIPIVAYSALAQGVLTGKFSREPQFAADDFRPRTIPFQPTVWPRVCDFVETAAAACRNHRTTLPKAAVSWLLQNGADSVLFGARSPAQLAELWPLATLPDALATTLSTQSRRLQSHLPAAANFFNYDP